MLVQRVVGTLAIIVGAFASVSCGQGSAQDQASDLAPVALQETVPRETGEAERPRIVFLGDSLTAGLGLDQKDAVPSLIQERLDAAGYQYEVVNAGVSGDTSAGGLSRLEWSLSGKVEILVVELGGNDGLRGLPVSQMRENLSEIITRAKTRGITVILAGMEAPPNYGPEYTAAFRKVFPDLAREHDVPLVPFFLEGVAGDPSLNQRDGIHPNPAGARIVEETVWRTLEPELMDR